MGKTRGYGMAVLLLLASTPTGGAWLPRFPFAPATTSTTRSVKKMKGPLLLATSPTSSSEEEHEKEQKEIAKAWNRVDKDMNRNDQAALEVLKELRASLKSLEASVSQAHELSQQSSETATTTKEIEQKETDTILVQAHDVMDEEAAHLVAQLANMEAMELAKKESRIDAAKQASEGVLLQAKLDLQQQQQLPITSTPIPTLEPPKQQEEVQAPEEVLLQAHDLVDDEAARLVAELAALDAKAKALRESLIDSARAESEGVTMDAKIDQQLQQQQQPEGAQLQPSLSLPEQEEDAEANKLVAELAALDAAELAFKENLIQNAHEAAEGVTMKAKLDQQLAAATSTATTAGSPTTATTMTPEPMMDAAREGIEMEVQQQQQLQEEEEEAAAAQLVAQLAAQDAADLAWRESLINKARDDSEMITMKANSEQQQQQAPPSQEERAVQPPVDTPPLVQAHDMVDDQDAKLVAELAALDANAEALKESLIDSARARAASEGVITMDDKIDQQLLVVDLPPPPAMETIKIDQQQEESVPLPVVEEEDVPQEVTMVDGEAPQLGLSQLASSEDATELSIKKEDTETAGDDSEIQTMQDKVDQQKAYMDMARELATEHPTAAPPKTVVAAAEQARRLKSQLASLEAARLAVLMDIAKSDAVREDAKLVQEDKEATMTTGPFPDGKKIVVNDPSGGTSSPAADHQPDGQTTEMVKKSEAAVNEDVKVAPSPPTRKKVTTNEEEKRRKTRLAAMEAQQLAIEVDIAKSNAVAADAMEVEEEEPPTFSKKIISNGRAKKLLAEVEQFAIEVDMAKSNAVKEDARLSVIEAAKEVERDEVLTLSKKIISNGQAKKLLAEVEQFAIQVDMAKSDAVKEDAARLDVIAAAKDVEEGEVMTLSKKIISNGRDKKLVAEAEQFAMQVDMAKSDAVKEDARLDVMAAAKKVEEDKVLTLSKKTISNGQAKKLLAEAEQFAIQVDMAKSDAVKEDARLDALCVTAAAAAQKKATTASTTPSKMSASVAAARVIEPVVMAAERITQAIVQEEAVVEAIAEPIFLSPTTTEQNPNQVHEVIDVQALKAAAQEVQQASAMLAANMPESAEKQAIIRAAKEAAESVLKEVQAQERKLPNNNNNNNKNVIVEESTNSLQNNGISTMKKTSQNKVPAVGGQTTSAATVASAAIGLEPLPQDVRNHQEDAARFFFAKRAAQEISIKKKKKKDRYYYLEETTTTPPPQLPTTTTTTRTKTRILKREEEEDTSTMSAAELAAKEHDEVDRQLKELFADVSLGFKEVKQSLSRLLRSDEDGDPNEGKDGTRNSTAWEGFSP